ncbi:hypothetical protein GT025_36520 [Streptomyces sp. SID4920]|nr:hypothetical protein [Streptomyces sp. SID4920]MYX64322.1 hypothetical protein [Streptomyces sp. SID8373]
MNQPAPAPDDLPVLLVRDECYELVLLLGLLPAGYTVRPPAYGLTMPPRLRPAPLQAVRAPRPPAGSERGEQS